jgi:SAM-dependent methyltransferase
MDEVENSASDGSAVQRWRTRWRPYIKGSKRDSSSARTTAENFIKLARIARGSSVVDLGCGNGRITELLVERVPSLELFGVDFTRPMLDSFLVKPGTNECKIELVCADITKLPLEDDSFDAVVSSRTFQYLPDPLCGVREALRVLKPGGRLVVSIPNKLNFIRYLTYDKKLYSPFEVRDWFRKCGLGNIEYGSMCFFPSSTRWKKLALSLEVAAKMPFLKYLGGNLIVTGEKKKDGPKKLGLGSLNQTTLAGGQLPLLLAAKLAVGAGMMARCFFFEYHHLVKASISILRMLWRLTRIYAT